MPPSQGSVNETFSALYCVPLVEPEMVSDCPSPVGTGRQALGSNIRRTLKLPNFTPTVPTNMPPPQPPLSCSWSLLFSSTVNPMSTVPFCALGTGFTPSVSGLKYCRFASSRIERMILVRLKSSPGMVRSSRRITCSFVRVLPAMVTWFMVAWGPSNIRISSDTESFSTSVSTAVMLKNR